MTQLISTFLGVQEVIDDKTLNAVRGATIGTFIIACFALITFVTLSFDLSYSVIPNTFMIAVLIAILVVYFSITYVYFLLDSSSPLLLTANTNLSYDGVGDFMHSLGSYSRSRALANRALGAIELYDFGIRGFISVSWRNITTVERTTPTDVALSKRLPSGFGKISRFLKTDKVFLRFQSPTDAEHFIELTNRLVQKPLK